MSRLTSVPKYEHDFWRDLWYQYCDVTHLHGFLEMNTFKKAWNRTFWILAILGGVGFALTLVSLGFISNLKEPIVTWIQTNRSDALAMTITYCTTEWIDYSKLDNYGATERDVHYATSHFKDGLGIYSTTGYAFMSKMRNVNWNNDEMDFNMRLLIDWQFLMLVVKEYLRETQNLPLGFSYLARKVFKLMQEDKLGYPFLETHEMNAFELCAKANDAIDNLYNITMAYFLQNKTQDLFRIVYRYFPLSFFQKTAHSTTNPENFILIYKNIPPQILRLMSVPVPPKRNRYISDHEKYHMANISLWSLTYHVAYNAYKGYEPSLNEAVNAELDYMRLTASNHTSFACLTLEALDKMHAALNNNRLSPNEFYSSILEWCNCTAIFDTLGQLSSSLSPTVPRKRYWAEYIVMYLSELTYHRNSDFDYYRMGKIVELMKKNTQFAEFIGKSNFTSTLCIRELLAEYAMEQCQNSSQLIDLFVRAHQEFLEMEEDKFNQLLRRNNFSNAFDFLMAISTDLNQYVVWLSASSEPTKESNRIEADINATKIMTGIGMCLRLSLNASMQSHFSRTATNLNGNRKIQPEPVENYYFNIIPLFSGGDIVIAFGDAANDLVPGLGYKPSDDILDNGLLIAPRQIHSYRIKNTAEDKWWENYTRLTISSRVEEIRQNRHNSPCRIETTQEKLKNGHWRYNMDNCLLTCDDYVTQPKWNGYMSPVYSTSFGSRCYLPYQNLPSSLPDSITIPQCSYFVHRRGLWNQFNTTGLLLQWEEIEKLFRMQYSPKKLMDCISKCLQPCHTLHMHIDMSTERNRIMASSTWPEAYQNTLHIPLQPGPDKIYNVSDGFQFDVLRKFNVGKRIEVQIDPDSILYEEKRTKGWDELLGFLGGQFGMVTGASILTFVQFFWVAVNTIYLRRHPEDHDGFESENESSAPAADSEDEDIISFHIIPPQDAAETEMVI